MRIKTNTSEVPVLQVTLNSRLNLIDEFSYTEYYNSEHFLLQKLGYSYKKAQVQMKSKSITRSNKATNHCLLPGMTCIDYHILQEFICYDPIKESI